MKKLVLLILSIAILMCLVACNNEQSQKPTPEHTHSFGEWFVTKNATCNQDGLITRYCDCGEKQSENIPATGEHTVAIDSAVAPSCTETGLTEGKYCSVCNKVLVEQEVIPAGHSFSDWKIIKKATETEEGLKERYCNVCEQTQSVVIAKLIPSQGLEFALNDDGKSYSVVGIGTCTDTTIVIPTTYKDLQVTSIGDYAFEWCTSLTSVVIPDSVTSIGEEAFSYCTSLTSVVIPDSVTSIGDYAFYYCTSLKSVVIGDSVTSIGYDAFAECTALTSIEVDENNEYYCSIDGNLYNKDATILIRYVIGKTDTVFTIPNSVTSIGDSAFCSCDSLTSIVIPDSVSSIGEWAFTYCTSLTNIVIPDSVTSIGLAVFYNCWSLTSVEIPASVTSFDSSAFSCCYSLTSIQFKGTKVEWNSITKGKGWNDQVPATEVKCSDGVVSLQ